MAITFCANIIGLTASVLLDAIRVDQGVCAYGLKDVKLARQFRDVHVHLCILYSVGGESIVPYLPIGRNPIGHDTTRGRT